MDLVIFSIPESEAFAKVLLFFIKLFNRSILLLWSEPTTEPSISLLFYFISYILSK